MKERFNEILQNHCDEYGVTREEVFGHIKTHPLPEIRAKVIAQYKDEYPSSTWRCIGGWMNRDHSSVINSYHKAKNRVYDTRQPPIIDYSKFVSFGYGDKIRFKFKYV